MKAKTLSYTLVKVKAEALVDALDNTQGEMEAETLRDKLAEVKAKALVYALASWPKEVERETPSEHWPM